MGWDLGRGNLSTVGVAHPRFQYLYLYRQLSEQTQLSKWAVVAAYTISMTISTRSRVWFYRSRSVQLNLKLALARATISYSFPSDS